MNGSLVYKVFVFDEGGLPTFIAAVNEESARKEYADLYSADTTECREVQDEALDRLKVAVTDENDMPTGETVTMREHLAEMVVGESGEPFYLCGEE